jgi:hypothetical protein
MATYNVARAKHATLAASTKDTVNFSSTGGALRVRNRSTSGDIYFTFDGPDPTIGGDDCYFVGPGENVVIEGAQPIPGIELISSGTPAYSAEIY